MKSFIQRWASSVVIQALGPLCAFATVFVVARLGGAAAQGHFAQTKAWIDLLVALGCFGFPQGIVYVVNRLGASAHRLAWYGVVYSLAFLPVAWAVTFVGATHGWAGLVLDGGQLGMFVYALAGALLVLHGLLRGVYLSRQQGASFALFSIMPAATLLVAVLGTSGQGLYAEQILAAAAVSALIGAGLLIVQLRRASAQSAATPWRALFSNSAQSFAQSVLMAVQPLLSYSFVRAAGSGDVEVGYLNAGVFLTQGLIVPIGLISPLVFARWTSRYDPDLLRRLQGHTARWLAWGALASVALAAWAYWATPLIFGAGYQMAASAVALMVLTVPQAIHGRLLAPALHAQGQPGINTIGAAVRLVGLAVVGGLLVQSGVTTLDAMALGWSGGELLSLAWTLWLLRRLSAPVSDHATLASKEDA